MVLRAVPRGGRQGQCAWEGSGWGDKDGRSRKFRAGDLGEGVLERSFDRRTVSRARDYASSGAVLDVDWDPDGEWVAGWVLGSGSEPYEVFVDFVRGPSGQVEEVNGECTCPVGSDCKHAAALLLSLAVPDGSTPSATSPQPPPTSTTSTTWADALAPLLRAGSDPLSARSHSPTAIGLQFELVLTCAGSAAPRARIRVRPVVQGASGNWVRTGVSWRTVDYLGTDWFRRAVPDAHVLVLKELRSLGTLSPQRAARSYTSYAGAPADELWLDSVGSRRVWDLLAEADDVGVPLVGSGRAASAVTIHRTGTELLVDAVATPAASGVLLRPRLVAGTVDVSASGRSSILVGTPPHGVAWWDAPGGAHMQPQVPARPSIPSGDTPALSFAPLAHELTAPRRALLSGGPLFVPETEMERFASEVYPRLSAKVRIESTDASVDLPELGEQVLILTLRHGAGHRLDLTWSAGIPETPWREPLHHPGHRLPRPLSDALREILSTTLRHPLGRELAPYGDRLLPEASLQGLSTVRFLTELLPAIEALPQLVVEHHGAMADYHEVTEAPAIALHGVRGIGAGDHDWFDLAVEVQVGGEDVPFVELFTALAGGQSHMLLPSGTYFSLESEALHELSQLIAEARALHAADGDRIRVTRYQASLWEDFERLGIATSQAADWERSVRALAAATDRPVLPAPVGLDATLRPYQHVGFEWLVYLYELGLGGVLADDMGLGKTLQVLALACHVRERRLDDRPFLVVAPTSVVGNWAAECGKFAPGLRVRTVRATEARRGVALQEIAEDADLVVTSYALFRLEHDRYAELGWAGLVLDEAQFAKNTSSHAYHRAKALPTRFKLAVTGTPMENHLMELWALMSITAPGLLGSAERFAEYYRLPIERRADEDRLALLRRRMKPLLLRRSKEQVATELPAKQENVLELELAPRHRKLYQTYLQRERQKVLGLMDDMQRNRFEILKSLTVLRQACLDVRLVEPDRARSAVPSTKLDVMTEMLTEVVADGHTALVFSQFTRFLSMARERVRAAGIAHCYLDGRTRNREAVLARFRTGEVPVFLVSLKAGGFGLNLTEADYCILLDPWWNPATEAQAIDRVHRIGQQRNVMVYRLVAQDTIEEKVMALKARKAALFASVVGGGGFESGALSATDLRALLD